MQYIKVYETSLDDTISIQNKRNFTIDNYGIVCYDSIQLKKEEIPYLIKELEKVMK